MSEGGEPPESDRPRWEFSWGINLQRIGRNRRERSLDNERDRSEALSRAVIYIALGGIALLEIALALYLGLLPL